MTKNNESFFSMALKVRNFGRINATTLNAIPGVSAQFTQLNTLIDSLITTDTGSRTDLTGVAITKQNIRKLLETVCLKFSNALAGFAVNSNDLILQKKADYPSSKWYSCSEDELISNANIIKNLATPIMASLAPYNLTATDLTAFNTVLNSFTDSVSDPSLAIDKRKTDNENIPLIIDQIRSLFNDKLDILVRTLEVSNPNMYNMYNAARAIDTNGSIATPTIELTIASRTVSTVHTATIYNADTFYTIQNIGNEGVSFSLSTTTNTEGADPVLLEVGETRSRLAVNLAPDGVFLVVNNPSLVPVKVKVWVE